MIEAEDYLIEVMRKRLRHLSSVMDNQGNAEIMKDYFSKRLNRIIIDYLLRENYFDSAKLFIDETGLKVIIFHSYPCRISLTLKFSRRLVES